MYSASVQLFGERVATYFVSMLDKKGHYGTLRFNHESGTLEMDVRPSRRVAFTTSLEPTATPCVHVCTLLSRRCCPTSPATSNLPSWR